MTVNFTENNPIRYLTENKEYTILYSETVSMMHVKGSLIPVIEAWVYDNNTNEMVLSDYEQWKGENEPCLMKLGKRLQRKWQSRKK